MKVDLFASVAPLERTLDYHLERHAVLASNLANAETPGYQPKDLVRNTSGFSAVLAQTNPAHIGAGTAQAAGATVVNNQLAATAGDQNGVQLERAMAEIAANRVLFDATVELTRRRMGLLRYAAGNGAV